MAKIFISYKRLNVNKVLSLVKDIEQKTNTKCWIDLDGIESGSQFETKIISALNEADIILFMMSKESLAPSPIEDEPTWTQKELSFALAKHKKIVVVSIDGSNIADNDWYLLKLGTYDTIDANNPLQWDKLLRNISKWCDNETSNSHNTSSAPQSTPNSTTQTAVPSNSIVNTTTSKKVNDIFKTDYFTFIDKVQEIYASCCKGLATPTSPALYAMLDENKFKNKIKTGLDITIDYPVLSSYRRNGDYVAAVATSIIAKANKEGYTLMHTEGLRNAINGNATIVKQCAERGNARAMYMMANIDASNKANWLQKSAQGNYEPAKKELAEELINEARLLKANHKFEECQKKYEQAAIYGSDVAAYDLGMVYLFDLNDKQKARYWLTKAGQAGNKDAISALQHFAL